MMQHNYSNQHLLLHIIFSKAIIAAYRKTEEFDKILKSLELEEEKTDFERIRCPLCDWRPTKSSLWCCADADAPEYFYDGCFTNWNTFETHGKCPTCAHQWRFTSCLRCGQWSLHNDWYQSK